MKDEIALRIMAYWGYGPEFDPGRYAYIKDENYTAKKQRKYEHAKGHAQALAQLAVDVFEKTN